MSFLGVLSKIHSVLQGITQIATPLEPLAKAIPTVGPLFDTILQVIIAVEKLVPGQDQGAVKKAIVTQIVQVNSPVIDPTTVGKKIDEVVTSLNALQKVASE